MTALVAELFLGQPLAGTGTVIVGMVASLCEMRHLANTYHLSKEADLRKTPKNGKSRAEKGDTMTVSCGVNPDTDSVEGRDGRYGRPPE